MLFRSIILVHIITRKSDGSLIGDPEIVSRGFTSTKEADGLLNQARKTILNTIKRNPDNLEKNITKTLSGFIYRETRRRPTIMVTISSI